jgi:hypothetical protein
MTTSETKFKIVINISSAFLITYLFLILWCVAGIIAFITSVVCFFRNGTIFEKILGLILALFLGPFYFIFYAFSDNYCN